MSKIPYDESAIDPSRQAIDSGCFTRGAFVRSTKLDQSTVRTANVVDSYEQSNLTSNQLQVWIAQNLLLNAIDAMPGGGELTVRTRRTDNGLRLDVSDTGTGLTDEECKRLFTPYYTTKQHGTGLGLAIVQSVVADHSGRIWVESKPGRGTTFHVELPDE